MVARIRKEIKISDKFYRNSQTVMIKYKQKFSKIEGEYVGFQNDFREENKIMFKMY